MEKITERLPSNTALIAMLEAVQQHAKVRCLSDTDICHCRKVFVAFERYCARNGLRAPTLEANGGAVANSYRYGGETTRVMMAARGTAEGEDRTYAVSILRGAADRRPHGHAPWLRLHAVRIDPARAWDDLPPLWIGEERYKSNKAGFFY